MYIRPGAASEIGDQVTDVEGSLTGFFKIDDQGELHIYDGPESNEWLPTGATFDLDENGNATNWIRLSFRQDFENGLWDIAIDGHIFRANLAMADRAESLEKIEFVGQSRSPLYIDDIQVSRDAIAFSDADRDGLPDDWEAANDLNRNDDLDQDGLTNVEEFVLGTDVNASDTDGDRVSDGDEYEAGSDPLDGVNQSESAAASWSSLGGLNVSLSPYGSDYHFVSVSWSSYTQWKIWVYNDWGMPYTYQYMSGQSVGQGSPNWTGGTDYVVTLTADVSFIYIWAVDHTNGNREDSLFLKTYSGGGELLAQYTTDPNDSNGTSLDGGNLGSDQAAIEALDNRCDLCGRDNDDSDCDQIMLNSVKFRIGLGKANFGQLSPVLSVHERELGQHSYSRESIRPPRHQPENGIDVRYAYVTPRNTYGRPTSAKAIRVVDSITTNSAYTKLHDITGGYQIDQYSLSQIDGVETPKGMPYKTVKVYNPDHPVIHSVNRRLMIEKTEEGRTSIHEYRYHIDHANGKQEWQLFQGAAGSHLSKPLRLTELIIDDPNEDTRGDYTKTRIVKHWNIKTNQLETDTKVREVFRRFSFGERKIKRIIDPDNEALTVSLEYYGKESGGFPITGRVKSIQFADRGWEYYVYDQLGRETRVYRPTGNTPLPENQPIDGQGYEWAEIEYDGAGYQEKRSHYLNGVLTKLSYKRWEPEDLKRDRTLTHIQAASPDAEPDHPANEITVTVLRAQDRRVMRTEAPNGSSTHYRYALEQGNFITNVEQQFGDGTLKTHRMTITHPSGTILESRSEDGPSGITTQHRTVEIEALDERFRPTVTLDHISNKGNYSGGGCVKDVVWCEGLPQYG